VGDAKRALIPPPSSLQRPAEVGRERIPRPGSEGVERWGGGEPVTTAARGFESSSWKEGERRKKTRKKKEDTADLDVLQNLKNLSVVRITAPVEAKSEGVEASVADEDVHGLQAAEGVVGEIERVEEEHVGDAVACVDEVVAEVHDAHVRVLTQALREKMRVTGGRKGNRETGSRQGRCEGSYF
jgi:hypothetical protein